MTINIYMHCVSKAYNNQHILFNLSYKFTKNIYHITGNNGTGKSTLLRLICGIESPDSGTIVFGECESTGAHNIVKKNINYVPDNLEVYPFLKGKEFIDWISLSRPTEKDTIDTIIHCLNLHKYLNTKFSDMSFGTRKKFLIATALMGTPDFIILDEPMNGLDKDSQSFLISMLKERSDKSGIILTCHEKDLITVLGPYMLEISNHQLTEKSIFNLIRS